MEAWLASCEVVRLYLLNRTLDVAKELASEGEDSVVKGWVDEIESEVMRHLRGHTPLSLEQLAAGMKISEALALSYISMLVREGKVTIGGLGIREN